MTRSKPDKSGKCQEIGDFENWIKVMEYDLESIGSALGYLSTAGGNLAK